MTEPWTRDPLVREDAELRALLDRLASTATDPVDPATRAATLERLLAVVAERPAPVPPWRRRAQQVMAMTTAKVALAAGVAAATTGGLAATGSLPDPAQQILHEVGQRIGIDFPAAPGQATQEAGDRDARDDAPGRVAREDGDPDTTGRSYAPGRVGRDGDPRSADPVLPGITDAPEAPPTQGPKVDRDPATGSDAGKGLEAPPRSDAVPDEPGSDRDDAPAPEAPAPQDAPDQQDPPDPHDPPAQHDSPAGPEGSGTTEDAPGSSTDAPGSDGTPGQTDQAPSPSEGRPATR